MRRSIGVTLSAMLVFLGSLVALLFAVIGEVVLSGVRGSLVGPLIRALVGFENLFLLGFAAWGIASGVGLMHLRQWARFSMLVFSGIMIAFCSVPLLVARFVSTLRAGNFPVGLPLFMRGSSVAFNGFFIALGILWIYFFNRRSVIAQFGRLAVTSPVLSPRSPIPVVVLQQATPIEKKKPVLIIVIAILLLVGACSVLFSLMTHTPALFFGYDLQGLGRYLAVTVLGGLSLIAGVGLLKLRFWGWVIALFLEVQGIVNTVCFFLIPGAMERFNSAIQQMYTTMGIPESMFPPVYITLMTAAMRAGLVFGVLLALATISVLIAYRKEFQRKRVEAPADNSI